MKLYAASHVVVVYNHDNSAILLHLRTGRRVHLNPVAGTVWKHLTAPLDLEQALRLTAVQYSVALKLLQTDIRSTVVTLQEQRMLVTKQPSRPQPGEMVSVRCGSPQQGEAAVSMVNIDAEPAIDIRYRLAGFLASAAARVLLQLPFPWLLRILRAIRRHMPRSSSSEEAHNIVRAVTRSAHWHLGRSACWELSVSAFLTGAILGSPPDWCLGSRFDPIINHAWIEVDHVPVDEPEMMGMPYGVHVRV